MSKAINKQYAEAWEELKESILSSTPVDKSESAVVQLKRKRELEADPEKWFKWYFPKFAYAAPADFHKAATQRVVNNPEWYEVRAWSRELAKSTRTMMEVLFLVFTGRKKNILLTSSSQDNAMMLLLPYKTQLETNQRLIHDYGVQERTGGQWEAHKFTTKGGASFRAIGAKQNPRGARKDEARPDTILIDDLDTDETCRNEELTQQTWEWVEQALIGTRSISNPMLIIFCGNIIAEDSCITRAIEKADYADIINIRDNNGKSSWPAKNTEEMIDRVLSKISYESQQKEYFNNPMSQGKTFPEVKWGVCPDLARVSFAVIYADPAPSNNDKPSLKSKSLNSHKAVFLMAKKGLNYYVYYGFLDAMGTDAYVDALFATKDYAVHKINGGKTALYIYQENNSLQDPMYSQLILPKIIVKARQRNTVFGITPDTREKPEKWLRIEANLEPINRLGNLVFNIKEKDNPHMQRLEKQFKTAKPTSKRLDGPDCIEGGKFIIDQKEIVQAAQSAIKYIPKSVNKKRF